MSKLPTLYTPGALRDPEGRTGIEQERLNEIVPIDHIIKWFADRKDSTGIENRMLIVKAGTSSGKSTALPVATFLQQVRYWFPKRGLICLQPKVLTSIKNVLQILQVPNYKAELKLGIDIGWSTQYDKLKPKKFGILSATIGTLTAIMNSSSDAEVMDKFAVIMVDETHERGLNTDMAILMLWNFLIRNASNPKCPFVVFMSATFDPIEIIDYFKIAPGGDKISLLGNFINVTGRAYPIETHWPESFASNDSFTAMASKRVREICMADINDTEGPQDILIFMPGNMEIMDTENAIKKVAIDIYNAGGGMISLLAIDSKAVATENTSYQLLDIDNSEYTVKTPDGKHVHPRRKVVISTNVAETGLTLDNLKYVIDAGFNRGMEFNPNFNTRTLKTDAAPKSRITQRRGRVGRKSPGHFHPLYTENTYEAMQDQQFPEIVVDDFSQIIMPVLVEHTKNKEGIPDMTKTINIDNIKMLTQPPRASLLNALEKAYKLGMIRPVVKNKDGSEEGGRASIAEKENTDEHGPTSSITVTPMGLMCVKMNISMEVARIIFGGHIYKYSVYDCLMMAIALEISARDLEKTKWNNVYAAAMNRDIPLNDIISSSAPISDNIIKYRLLIADNFIDLLMLMHACIRMFAEDIDKDAFLKFIGVKDSSLETLMLRRDQLMNQCLVLGFDIQVYLSETITDINVSPEVWSTRLTRLKYIIHDAFMGNLLVLTEGRYMFKGIVVSVPPWPRQEIKTILGVTDDIVYPKILTFSSLSVASKNGRAVTSAERVSSLSGYVYPNMH